MESPVRKDDFLILRIKKSIATPLLKAHHYLGDSFKSGDNFGLFLNFKLVGVCIFTGLSVPETAQSCFGLERDDQSGLYELSRLCLDPEVQATCHNAASWFVARCIKKLRTHGVRAIITYADSDHHEGTVYKALGFASVGLTKPKKDFYYLDGTKHNRGAITREGTWEYRSQKHRFVKVFDNTLSVLWREDAKQ